MDIKQFFNLIIYSLSIATLLITIVSYIIFRLRYSAQKKHVQDEHHLNGLYFDRYAPHLDKINQDRRKTIESKIRRGEFWRRRPALLFLFIGIIIAIFLSTEGYFLYKKELRHKQLASTNYRNLIAQGLLKVTSFNNLENFDQSEVYSLAFEARHSYLLTQLKKEEFIVYYPKYADEDKKGLSSKGNWLNWLSKKKIPHRVFRQCKSLFEHQKIIIPLFEILPNDIACLNKLRKENKSFLIVNDQNLNLLSEWFGLSMSNLNRKAGVAIFSSSVTLGETPVGISLDWPVISNKSFNVSDRQTILALNKHSPNLSFNHLNDVLTVAKHNSIWTLLEPVDALNDRYADHVLLNLLASLSSLPKVSLATWPYPYKSASAIGIDSEDKLNNLKLLLKLNDKREISSTVFMVSDLLIDNIHLLSSFTSLVELASHTDDHRNLGERDLAYDFDRLQKSRLDLEEIAKGAVTGFRPPEEYYNQALLNVIIHAGFRYMFADQRKFRLTPYLINQGNFVIFPRVLEDDYLLSRNRMLFTSEHYLSRFIDQYNVVKNLGGLHLLSLHTNFLGDDRVMLSAYSDFLDYIKNDNDVYHAHFSDIANWWQIRSRIDYKLKKLNSNWVLSVTNKSEVVAQNIKFNVCYLNFCNDVVFSSVDAQVTEDKTLEFK